MLWRRCRLMSLQASTAGTDPVLPVPAAVQFLRRVTNSQNIYIAVHAGISAWFNSCLRTDSSSTARCVVYSRNLCWRRAKTYAPPRRPGISTSLGDILVRSSVYSWKPACLNQNCEACRPIHKRPSENSATAGIRGIDNNIENMWSSAAVYLWLRAII